MEEFEELYRTYYTPIYQYALSLCREPSLAEELAQETFFRAMESIDRFRGECRVYVWLCQIAKNAFLSHCRRQRRFTYEPPPERSGTDMESEVLSREDTHRLHRLLHDLPEPYKEVFTLRVFGELPYARIGELFGKSDSWARLIFFRAKNELRRQLDESTEL